MRITFVLAHLDLSGGAKVVTQYADQLAARGHDVSIVVSGAPAAPLRQRIRNALFRKPPQPGHRPGEGVKLIRSRLYGPALANDLPEADVLVATWWETVEWLEEAPATKGARAYFIQDHEIFPGLPPERTARTYRLPFHKIVVSRWLLETMRTTYGDEQVSLALNGVDTSFFRPAPGERSRRAGLVFSKTPRKNSAMALDAVRLCGADAPPLVCFGNGPRPQDPNGLIREYHQQPPQALIPEIYGSCRLWLFPSASEGYGLPILEAMACGTPLVATRAGAAPDLVTGENGLLVDTHPEAMRDGIRRILSLDEAEWQRMSQAARATADAHDLEKACDGFEQALLTARERGR